MDAKSIAKERRKAYSGFQHTIGHLECPACEESRTLAMHATSISDSLLFPEAAKYWIESRQIDGNSRTRLVKSRTLKDYEQYSRPLSRFFGELRLKEIHIGHLKSYQSQRAKGELGLPDELVEVGPNKINQELWMLTRILKHANAWSPMMEDLYEALQTEESDVARALNPQEQQTFLRTAASREEWQLVYWYSLLALHTTANNCELRGLRLGDAYQQEEYIKICPKSAKNQYRIRTIPLTSPAVWALNKILIRAYQLGVREPQHYIMPFRVHKNCWDVTKPITNSGFKKPWDEVRKAAGVPWLRIHDLRHTAITRLAEAGTALPVIMSMSGHISRKMMQHYTHISDHAKRKALEAAHGKKQPSSFPQAVMTYKPLKTIEL